MLVVPLMHSFWIRVRLHLPVTSSILSGEIMFLTKYVSKSMGISSKNIPYFYYKMRPSLLRRPAGHGNLWSIGDVTIFSEIAEF